MPAEQCDTGAMARCASHVETEGKLSLGGGPSIDFAQQRDMRFVIDRAVAFDGNAMRFIARDTYDDVLRYLGL